MGDGAATDALDAGNDDHSVQVQVERAWLPATIPRVDRHSRDAQKSSQVGQPPAPQEPAGNTGAQTDAPGEPASGTWFDYACSLPERVVRSASAISAGLLRELGDVAVPAPLRRTLLYKTLVTSTLRFLIEQVGEVEGTFPDQGELAKGFALRRTAGNGLELLGILAFRASPVWVMAALADVSGAGRHLVREIAEALQEEGLLEPGAGFETVDQILDGLEATSARVAESVNTPPLDVATLRREWQELKTSAARIPPRRMPSPQRLQKQWAEIRATAEREQRSVFEVSAVMGLAAIEQIPASIRWLSKSAVHAGRRTGQVLALPLLDHYSQTLGVIREQGFVGFWTQQFRPYLRAAAAQFSSDRATLTRRLLGHLRKK